MATRDAIQTALDEFEQKMTNKQVSISMAEYLKLLQLSQELADDEPKEIKVEWIEPPASAGA
jgi:hypothetical protein